MYAVGRGLNSTVQCCMKLLAAIQKSEQGNLVCAGEVDELEGLVTSLRAQCPIKDEPGHSNDIPHAASRSGDQQRPEKPPAESFTQVALTVQALRTLSIMAFAVHWSKLNCKGALLKRPCSLLSSCVPPLRQATVI